MALIAGLSLVAMLVPVYFSIQEPVPSAATDQITVTDPLMSWLFLAPAVSIFFLLIFVVSLIVYCVQWVVTLISAVMENHGSASS